MPSDVMLEGNCVVYLILIELVVLIHLYMCVYVYDNLLNGCKDLVED